MLTSVEHHPGRKIDHLIVFVLTALIVSLRSAFSILYS
ncbi:hypothetical protein NBRC111894_4570 [Sporolactobacillus inulinus]|uniref:Uncharacterized protein n=1 Tax=Sporolactobacillus inulinus TaxID=2078 RepID=A0A4Y1ZII5_9BACL|nr:hypothetical protein NBRC111894_4570 [Sporolactobacillus inulinus]